MTIKKIRETNGTDHFLAAKYDDSGNVIVNTYETKTDATTKLNKKANDFSLEIYNGTGGNPKPVKFMTVNYSTCGSENGVAVKLGLVSGHGNGTSYAFLEDAIVRVSYLGAVEVDNFKYYGASTGTYDGAERQYGDIFWVIDTTNKIVDFYVLMGQYARIQMIPAKRVTYSTGGTITQHTSCTVYSSGTKNWANNAEIATKNDIPEGQDLSIYAKKTDVEAALGAKVPNTRTVNGKALSSNISLSASDVGADASGTAQTKANAALADAKTYADSAVSTHAGNKNNPHGVTAAQVGAYTKAEIDAKLTPISKEQIYALIPDEPE